MKSSFTKSAIEDAHQRIKPYINKTPILSCSTINKMVGGELYFKCENFQKIGAFKMRGGTNAILQLSATQKVNGVVTHSSGNHAQAIAKAAQDASIPAYIVMPKDAPKVKVRAVEGYGGKISFCENRQPARHELAEKIKVETGATFIHPYDNPEIIIGQATVAKELFEEQSNLDYLVTPIGGGGLISGSILSASFYAPECKLIGVEPEGANAAYQALKKGKLVMHPNPTSIADGLLASLGQLNYAIIKNNNTPVLLVNDEEILSALKLIWERMKIIVEPSCAVPLAGIIRNKEFFRNKKVGIILTGGNVDFKHLVSHF